MKRLLIAVTFTALGVTGHATLQVPQFRTTVTGLGLHVIVRSGGQPVRDLTVGDFTLTDSGVPQEILAADAEGVPLDVTLVAQDSLTNGWFSVGTLEKEMTTISALIHPSDRLRVILAADDQREIELTVRREQPEAFKKEDSCRPIYDALGRALMRPTDPTRLHVIVLMSVGEGTGSILSTDSVSEIARRSGALLYVVSLEPSIGKTSYRKFVAWPTCPYADVDWSPSRRARLRQIERTPSAFALDRELWLDGKNRLVEVAKLTGGTEIRPTLLTDSTIGPVRRALEEVRSGYILRYTPKGVSETGWHPVTVTVGRSGSYRVQARPGYQR